MVARDKARAGGASEEFFSMPSTLTKFEAVLKWLNKHHGKVNNI
jgi:hypothetical protein